VRTFVSDENLGSVFGRLGNQCPCVAIETTPRTAQQTQRAKAPNARITLAGLDTRPGRKRPFRGSDNRLVLTVWHTKGD
jgi:hypothetical protein